MTALPATPRPLEVGVVGLGIGQLHLLSWLEVQGANVVVIADTDAARRDQASTDWGVEAVDSLEAMLGRGVDVVDLCTPPSLHEAQIIACLDAGTHVICEKPLVDSVAACDRLAAAAQRAATESGARLMPIFQYRFGEGAARARALIDAGLTGKLHTASSSTWWRRERGYYDEAPWRGTWAGERGGSVLSHAIHNHDLLTWIGGPLAQVQALTATRVNDVETEDCAVAIGRTTDGALVTMNVTLGAAEESSRLTWLFEHVSMESSIEPYDPARGPWEFRFFDDATQRRAEEAWATMVPAPRQYTGQFQQFVGSLAAEGEFPVTLADATAALELVTAWYHSSRTGAADILPLAADHPDRGSWRPPGVQ